MIERVRFKNYKALQDVEIEFGRFTVLVGANACGKSSVLQGIDQLTYEVGSIPLSKAGGERTLARIAGDLVGFATLGFEQPRMSLRAEFTSGGVEIQAQRQSEDDCAGVFGWLARDGWLTVEPKELVDFIEERKASFNWKSVYLELNRDTLAEPSTAEERVYLAPDGEGLSSVLVELALNEPHKLQTIRADLARIVPGLGVFRFPRKSVARREEEVVSFDGRSFTRTVVRSHPGFELMVELEGMGWLPAEELSEGTLLTLGLLTAVHTSEANIVMFDDLDRGLHPRAQGDLISCLRQVLEQRPELQIICTTHSPYLLNHFEADEVRVMGLDEHRHAHVRTLSDHPEWAKWKETMQVGEFWSVVGDDWAGRDDDD